MSALGWCEECGARVPVDHCLCETCARAELERERECARWDSDEDEDYFDGGRRSDADGRL